jgi:hypothetical protein
MKDMNLLEKLINYVSPFHNFGANRILVTTSNSSSILVCLFVVLKQVSISQQWSGFYKLICCIENIPSEPLSSNGVQASCHIMQKMAQKAVILGNFS